MTPRALGGLVALAVFAADQAVKLAVLALGRRPRSAPTPLAPFLDLALRWNRGHLLQPVRPGHRRSAARSCSALTLGGDRAARLVAGGEPLAPVRRRASGRSSAARSATRSTVSTHGAVVDYLDLHAFGRHFFVFNLADAAINVGVALLVIDLAFGSRRGPAGGSQPRGPRAKEARGR